MYNVLAKTKRHICACGVQWNKEKIKEHLLLSQSASFQTRRFTQAGSPLFHCRMQRARRRLRYACAAYELTYQVSMR
jgi:hypothetical protein